jgi:hypothetical protein
MTNHNVISPPFPPPRAPLEHTHTHTHTHTQTHTHRTWSRPRTGLRSWLPCVPCGASFPAIVPPSAPRLLQRECRPLHRLLKVWFYRALSSHSHKHRHGQTNTQTHAHTHALEQHCASWVSCALVEHNVPRVCMCGVRACKRASAHG